MKLRVNGNKEYVGRKITVSKDGKLIFVYGEAGSKTFIVKVRPGNVYSII